MVRKIKPMFQFYKEKDTSHGLIGLCFGINNNNEFMCDIGICFILWHISCALGITIIKKERI